MELNKFLYDFAAFDCGEQLTPTVEAVLPEVVQYICALISRPPKVPSQSYA